MAENQEQQQQEEQIETVDKAQYDALVAELEEVKGKLPKTLTDDEKAIQAKQQELWQKEVTLSLKENGLEKFSPIIKVSNEDELKEVISTLDTVINELKVENGYVPTDHKQTDPYSKFEQEKNTKGMIGSKLANLFK